MAAEGSQICGGVSLLHTEQEGKHSYEVKDFISTTGGLFARKGDKFLMINDMKMEDLTPEEFVHILVEGSPLLTIHQPCEEKRGECASEEIRAYKKEPTVMKFSLAMVREEDLQPEENQEEPHPDQDWENFIQDDNLLFVSLAKTSFTMVLARGCDSTHPCHNCGRTDCQFNEVVVMPERAEVAYNAALIVNQIKERDNLFLKSYVKNKYVTPWNEQLLLKDTMSARITIYYYKINVLDKTSGSPVVLNFTDTDNFFCCTTKQGEDTKILTVMPYRKSELKNICADERGKWSLVFYMSSSSDNYRRFESALYRGWFIYIQSVDTDKVEMREKKNQSEASYNFYFVIESQTTN